MATNKPSLGRTGSAPVKKQGHTSGQYGNDPHAYGTYGRKKDQATELGK